MAANLISSREKTNGAKLSRLIIDGGRLTAQNVFDAIHPPNTLQVVFNTHYITFQNLLTRRILTGKQWDLLFPPGGALPDPSSFDITFLFVLLRNICGMHPPVTGWDKKPPATDKSQQANLARIKWFRNEVYAHVTTTEIDAPLFTQYWVELSDTLVQLGLDRSEIDRLKSAPLDEDQYISLLSKWKRDDDDIKEKLETMDQKLDILLSKVFVFFFILKGCGIFKLIALNISTQYSKQLGFNLLYNHSNIYMQ